MQKTQRKGSGKMPHEHKYNPQLAQAVEDDIMRLALMWASLDYPPVQTVGVAASSLLVTLLDMLDEKKAMSCRCKLYAYH